MTTCTEAKNMKSGITIEAKIRDKGEPRTVNTKFGETQVCDAYLEDDSGSIKFTIWGDDIQKVKNGDQVKIENGYTTEFRGEVQLNKSRTGKMDVTPAADEAAAADKEASVKVEPAAAQEPAVTLCDVCQRPLGDCTAKCDCEVCNQNDGVTEDNSGEKGRKAANEAMRKNQNYTSGYGGVANRDRGK